MQFLATSSSVVILCYTLQCNIWTDRSWFDECCCLVDSTDFSYAFSVPSFFSLFSDLTPFYCNHSQNLLAFKFKGLRIQTRGFKVKIIFLEYISADLSL